MDEHLIETKAVTTTNDPVFISWIKYHGRSDGIAERLGIENAFFDGGSGPLLRRYLRQHTATRAFLRGRHPRSIIVMQPPLPAILSVLSTRAGRRARLVGDLHTGTFDDPKWGWALDYILRALRKRGLSVVTNTPLAERVRAKGGKAIVVHDVIGASDPHSETESFDDTGLAGAVDRPFILVPFAYANDEPVTALLDAARRSPDLTWVLTGRPPADVRSSASDNVVFTGYVSNGDYARLLGAAGVAAALTDREYTMQRVGYEALAAAKPLVTTGTETLREYFGDSAEYCSPAGDDILDAVRRALANSEILSERMVDLRAIKMIEQNSAFEELRSAIF